MESSVNPINQLILNLRDNLLKPMSIEIKGKISEAKESILKNGEDTFLKLDSIKDEIRAIPTLNQEEIFQKVEELNISSKAQFKKVFLLLYILLFLTSSSIILFACFFILK